MKFCLNGRFIDSKKATVSVLDRGFLFADGFYDTMRVYQGVLFELPLHLKRIEVSAKAMNITLPGTQKIIQWLERIVSINKLQEARVRITITRGDGAKPTIVITCEPLVPSPERNLLQRSFSRECGRECPEGAREAGRGKGEGGESACVVRFTRPMPEIKTLAGLSFLAFAEREKKNKKCDQLIGIDQKNFVQEAATSNVFVVKNGRLLTPKNGILKGLTRLRILALARRNGIPAVVRDFKTGVLKSADEIFLTNRIREIVPIVRLNGKKVGSGKIGFVTRHLQYLYELHASKSIAKSAKSALDAK